MPPPLSERDANRQLNVPSTASVPASKQGNGPSSLEQTDLSAPGVASMLKNDLGGLLTMAPKDRMPALFGRSRRADGGHHLSSLSSTSGPRGWSSSASPGRRPSTSSSTTAPARTLPDARHGRGPSASGSQVQTSKDLRSYSMTTTLGPRHPLSGQSSFASLTSDVPPRTRRRSRYPARSRRLEYGTPSPVPIDIRSSTRSGYTEYSNAVRTEDLQPEMGNPERPRSSSSHSRRPSHVPRNNGHFRPIYEAYGGHAAPLRPRNMANRSPVHQHYAPHGRSLPHHSGNQVSGLGMRHDAHTARLLAAPELSQLDRSDDSAFPIRKTIHSAESASNRSQSSRSNTAEPSNAGPGHMADRVQALLDNGLGGTSDELHDNNIAVSAHENDARIPTPSPPTAANETPKLEGSTKSATSNLSGSRIPTAEPRGTPVIESAKRFTLASIPDLMRGDGEDHVEPDQHSMEEPNVALMALNQPSCSSDEPRGFSSATLGDVPNAVKSSDPGAAGTKAVTRSSSWTFDTTVQCPGALRPSVDSSGSTKSVKDILDVESPRHDTHVVDTPRPTDNLSRGTATSADLLPELSADIADVSSEPHSQTPHKTHRSVQWPVSNGRLPSAVNGERPTESSGCFHDVKKIMSEAKAVGASSLVDPRQTVTSSAVNIAVRPHRGAACVQETSKQTSETVDVAHNAISPLVEELLTHSLSPEVSRSSKFASGTTFGSGHNLTQHVRENSEAPTAEGFVDRRHGGKAAATRPRNESSSSHPTVQSDLESKSSTKKDLKSYGDFAVELTKRLLREGTFASPIARISSRSSSFARAQLDSERIIERSSQDDSLIDLRLSHRYTASNLPDLWEEPERPQTGRFQPTQFRFPPSLVAGKDHDNQRCCVSKEGESSVTEPTRTPGEKPPASESRSISHTRDLPSLHFSRIDLTADIRGTLSSTSSEFLSAERRSGGGTPSATELRSRYKYQSVFSRLDGQSSQDELESEAVPWTTPTEVPQAQGTDEASNQPRSRHSHSQQTLPWQYIDEINRLSIPSASDLAQRFSEWIPSLLPDSGAWTGAVELTSGHNFDRTVTQIRKVGNVEHLRSLPKLPNIPSDVRLRPVPGCENLVVMSDAEFEATIRLAQARAANKRGFMARRTVSPEHTALEAPTTRTLAAMDLGFSLSDAARPVPALCRTRSESAMHHGGERSRLNMEMPGNSLPILHSSLAASRLWNIDESCFWQPNGPALAGVLPLAGTKNRRSPALFNSREGRSLSAPTAAGAGRVETGAASEDIVTGHAPSRKNPNDGADRPSRQSISNGHSLTSFDGVNGSRSRKVDPGDRYPTTGLTPPDHAHFEDGDHRSWFSDDSSLIRHTGGFRKRLTQPFRSKGVPSRAQSMREPRQRMPAASDGDLIHARADGSIRTLPEKIGMTKFEIHARKMASKFRTLWEIGGQLLKTMSGRRRVQTPASSNGSAVSMIDNHSIH